MLPLSDLTIVLLIAHVLGDFHLQSDPSAQSKQTNRSVFARRLLTHSVLYGFVWLLLWRAGFGRIGFFALVGLLATRAILGFAKIRWERADKDKKTNRRRKEWHVFLADQILHIAVLWGAVAFVFPQSLRNVQPAGFSREAWAWILLLALITKPANIAFKTCFAKYDTDSSSETATSHFETEPGAGATIGNLERILSALFLASGQYAAIGLIYTAKSITRFKKIEEDRRFGEYYLIGTLFSVLYVVVAHVALIGLPQTR